MADWAFSEDQIRAAHEAVKKATMDAFGDLDVLTERQTIELPGVMMCLYSGLLLETIAAFKPPNRGVMDIADEILQSMMEANADEIADLMGCRDALAILAPEPSDKREGSK